MRRIAIYGPPRSGTSWLAHLLNSHPAVALRFQPLFSYSHKNALSADSSAEEINVFFEKVLITRDSFALMKTEAQSNYPTFSKTKPTHLVTKEASHLHIIENLLVRDKELKILGLIRNPLATLSSWIRAPKEYCIEWDLIKEWQDAPSKNQGRQEEYYGYNKWKMAAENFLKLQMMYPTRFKLVNYSFLREQTDSEIAEIMNFCELSVSQQTRDFIFESKNRHDLDPYSVYRSLANDEQWREALPESIISKVFEDLKGTQLEQFLN